MMNYGTTFLLDTDGDFQFNELNKIKLTSTDAEKVMQDVKIALKTILGEDIFTPDFGFDLIKLKQYPFNQRLIESEIRKALKKYKYLKSIDTIEVGELDADRNVPVTVYVTTTYDMTLAIGVEL